MALTPIIPDSIRTWTEIDLSALRHNFGVARQQAGTRPEIMAVVKADAYGHGSREVAEALSGEAVLFGVANCTEAIPLLSLGRDIQLLSPCLPAERQEAVAAGLIITVSSAAEAAACSQCGPARITLKVDTV